MFSWEDFENNNNNSEHPGHPEDLGNLANFMMLVTNALKQVDFNLNIKSGNELMMKIFNMSNLSFSEENDDALNLMMALVSHIYAMLLFMDDRSKYFQFFDNAVVMPMINYTKE